MARRRPYMAGDQFSASWQNALMAEVRRSRIIQGKGIRVTQKPNGQLVEAEVPQEVYFKITSGTNPYAGTEQIAGASGTWSNRTGGLTPTTSVDPLYEATGNAAVPANRIVLAKRATATSAWIFYASACS